MKNWKKRRHLVEDRIASGAFSVKFDIVDVSTPGYLTHLWLLRRQAGKHIFCKSRRQYTGGAKHAESVEKPA